MDWNVAKGVQTQSSPSQPILATFTAGLDPFKAMALSVAVAKHLRRRQGRGGASTMTLSLSLLWICEMARQGAKAKMFCNVVTNSGC